MIRQDASVWRVVAECAYANIDNVGLYTFYVVDARKRAQDFDVRHAANTVIDALADPPEHAPLWVEIVTAERVSSAGGLVLLDE